MPLTDRQQKIINVFLEAPESTRSVSDFADFGLERTTVFRDIKKLVQAGLLQLEGKAYCVNTDSDAYLRWDLSRAPHHREQVCGRSVSFAVATSSENDDGRWL